MLARWEPGAAPADVLAGVAAALGAPWDGPGRPAPVDVPDGAPPWEVLDATRAALVAADSGERRRLGAHHTPPPLARRLAALALHGMRAGGTVADPACGGGAFLVAAGDIIGGDRAAVAEHQLAGADVDPLAVATTRAALWLWSGGATAHHVVVADGLTDWRPPATADVVLGNPPFRSPLAAGARRGRLGAYTDLAARFLAAALDLVAGGGAVLLLQPESVLAARDAAPVRDAALARARLDGVWFAGEALFDGAAVRTVAPLLRRDGRPTGQVRRWHGADVVDAGATAFDPTAPTWAHLRPGAPAARTGTASTSSIGDLATATAGFRDQFYALAEAATDDPTPGRLRLVTSGLIDPGHLAWGERPARIQRRTFLHPTVDLDDLDDRLRAWLQPLLRPKVLVATQTKRIEAAVDADGTAVPLTPVVAVVPHHAADLRAVADALLHDDATEWARRHYGGTGLGVDTFRLPARAILAIPVETGS